MSEFLEIEFKNGLTRHEYQKLIQYFNVDQDNCIQQENIYFDTHNLDLKQIHCALRVRVKENGMELTLKQKGDEGILETTDNITQEEWIKLLNHHELPNKEVAFKLKQLAISTPLYELARLTTLRYEIAYLNNLIALDESTYYGFTDYEIELETAKYEDGEKVFNDLLTLFQISRNETKSKIVRAYIYKTTKI